MNEKAKEETKIERHRAIVRISYEFMQNILFPEGTEILAISQDLQGIFGSREFICVIEHSDLPICEEGQQLLTVEPRYIQHYSGVEGEIPTVIFDNWGL